MVFQQGGKLIAAFAGKYGNDSPVLIKQSRYLRSRGEIYYTIPRPLRLAARVLSDAGFERMTVFKVVRSVKNIS